ncbi:MAG TPA: 4Fe-4S dicluster domain-containing protein [Candidatus Sulfotelmatobacter sp.]|nr:4Fe-4S dicluster domain-containing protein [Candidatus Sulfotelmatobacter sp.]
MARLKQKNDAPQVLEARLLPTLLETLSRHGYDVIGPTVRDGAIVLDHIQSPEQLPAGWTDEQTAGHYRLKSREDRAFFGYAVGPDSWKKYLHPAELMLWSAQKQNGDFRILNNAGEPGRPFALFGVRACDLAAIAKQDRVMMGDQYRNPPYASRRENAFIVAVQCTKSAETCFCASLQTGPRAAGGFDLCLTEMTDARGHCFVVRTGSKRGVELLSELDTTAATDEQQRLEADLVEAAARSQKRAVQTEGLKKFLEDNFDHEGWQKLAARCLTCGNCTMVCPTCFCTTVEDSSNLAGTHAERWRRWDSCFTLSFSYIHGGSIRSSTHARYRQWLTHKFSTWIDQFGSLGCVGCGRCITWCPVGIDVTESIRTLREGNSHGNP